MDTPVAVFCFNRPEATANLLKRLASVQPTQVFVVSDGPRPGSRDDHVRVAAVRRQFDSLSWRCRVSRDFAGSNLGCRSRIVSGLDWVFEQVDRAIILEDDCLPDPSFFPFCEDLLARYEGNTRIASVCGMTHDQIKNPIHESYRFSRYCFIWGWATWRRAWQTYDASMPSWAGHTVDALLKRTFDSLRARLYWKMIFNRCRDGRIDTWDYQWAFSCWRNEMMHIVPRVSMVENHGFGVESTHTSRRLHDSIPIEPMSLPLSHPGRIQADWARDNALEDQIFSRNFSARCRWIIRKYFPLQLS